MNEDINPKEQTPEDFYREHYYALADKYISIEEKLANCKHEIDNHDKSVEWMLERIEKLETDLETADKAWHEQEDKLNKLKMINDELVKYKEQLRWRNADEMPVRDDYPILTETGILSRWLPIIGPDEK